MPHVQIEIINLDRNPGRLARFHQRNCHLGDTVRFPAIEGRSLDRARLAADGIADEALPYTPGFLGSAMSHITLWRKAVDEARPITISEDDAILSHLFEARASALLEALRADWDIVLWGWNFDAFLWVNPLPGVSTAKMQFDQGLMRQNIDRFQHLDVSPAPMRLLHGFGMMCYTVSPKGGQALLDMCLPLRPALIEFPGFGVWIDNHSIDCMMNAAYPSLQAFVSMPPLAVAENRKESSTTLGS